MSHKTLSNKKQILCGVIKKKIFFKFSKPEGNLKFLLFFCLKKCFKMFTPEYLVHGVQLVE